MEAELLVGGQPHMAVDGDHVCVAVVLRGRARVSSGDMARGLVPWAFAVGEGVGRVAGEKGGRVTG